MDILAYLIDLGEVGQLHRQKQAVSMIKLMMRSGASILGIFEESPPSTLIRDRFCARYEEERRKTAEELKEEKKRAAEELKEEDDEEEIIPYAKIGERDYREETISDTLYETCTYTDKWITQNRIIVYTLNRIRGVSVEEVKKDLERIAFDIEVIETVSRAE